RCRLVELEGDPRRGVEVEEVRIRELLALKDRGLAKPSRTGTAGAAPDVPSGLLMRVLAVPEVANLSERDLDGVVAGGRFSGAAGGAAWAAPEAVAFDRDRRQRRRDRRVVGGRVRERLTHQLEAEC